MKKKIIIAFVFILILIIGLAIGWFWGQGRFGNNEKIRPNNVNGNDIFPEAARQDEILDRGGFSVLIPAGWKEVTAPTGVSVMVANAGEEISDPALQTINFRSYYSVSYDALKGKTLSEYSAYIKNMIKEFAPEIIFSSEENIMINTQSAYRIEADLNQQGADFKVLVFLIKGNNDDIWNMSFNSGLSGWEKNQKEFSRIADSFTVK